MLFDNYHYNIIIRYNNSYYLFNLLKTVAVNYRYNCTVYIFKLQIRNDDASVSIKELTRVSGIGPAKAKQLYDSGVTNIDILLKNQDKLNHHQILGLKYIHFINYLLLSQL